MDYAHHVVCVLLLLCPLALSRHDNFHHGFNNNEEIQKLASFNEPPILNHRIKKIAVTAGKTLRYIVPSDVFTDPEEGNNLNYTMYEAGNVPLGPESWMQFIPTRRMIYGLPLESHVSRWNFIIQAQDSQGLAARGPLDITVQQDKGRRTINHQFIMKVKHLKQFKNAIDWQIRILEGILNLFGEMDNNNLTVLNVTQNGDVYEFTWANDTLPKYPTCSIDDINRVIKIMESDTEPGRPSLGLTSVMLPDLEVLEIRWQRTGRCVFQPKFKTSEPLAFPPVIRNQIDHLSATAGYLFIYKVPEDTFFDLEEGGTRNLKLSLKFRDGSEVPSNHWLQFDARKQEFYGLATPSDEGNANYVLIATDSSNQTAYNSFTMEVTKAPKFCPTVEYQVTITPAVNLIYNASYKRKIIEKLAALFEENDTSNIRVQSITSNPTTIIWYNTRFSSKIMIESEELGKMIVVEGETRNGNINEHQISNKNLKITSIRLVPRGPCADQNAIQLSTN